MRSWKSLWIAVLALLVAVSWTSPALAQEAGAGRRGGAEGRQGRGGQRDPEEMRRRMEEFRAQADQRLRERLGATEAEWKIISERLNAVREAQGELRGGRFRGMGGMFGGRGGPGGRFGGERPGGDREPETEVGKKTQALATLLQGENPKAEDIKKALAELRAARKKAQAKIAAAQKKLKEVLTQKQEAMLVLMGTLE